MSALTGHRGGGVSLIRLIEAVAWPGAKHFEENTPFGATTVLSRQLGNWAASLHWLSDPRSCRQVLPLRQQ